MTLVLSYIDDHRIIYVADQRITTEDPDGTETFTDDQEVKAFVVRGSVVVSFAGLAGLNDDLDTTAWLYQRLGQATKNINDTLQDMADELPGLIHPSLRNVPLDVRVTGVMEHESDGAQIIGTGRLTNISAGVVKDTFTRNAKQERRAKQPTYRAFGSGMPQDVQEDLAATVGQTTSSIDIANHFLDAIRRTNAVKKYVGPTAVGVIVPFAALENIEDGQIDVAIDPNGRFADGRISISRAAEDCARFTLTPKDEVGFRYSTLR